MCRPFSATLSLLIPILCTYGSIRDESPFESDETTNEASNIDDNIKFDTNYWGDHIQTAYIDNFFKNKQFFSCQLVKNALRTGDSGANLSPEDIKIVAAMGDALSTGVGLWEGLNVEFRGAVFTVGGDVTIDDLVTLPNILSVFNSHLEGISHGIGKAGNLPDSQFNVAVTGAETDTMPEQARELVRRLHRHYTNDELAEKWVVVFITVGTEEMCSKCDEPNILNLKTALLILKHKIPQAFVVIIGPVHVTQSSLLNYNLLKPRCKCLVKLTNQKLTEIQNKWSEELLKLEVEFSHRNYSKFPVLTLPKLTIESRNPEQLFIAKRPLLNRKGHTYAAKWLWNRLISGPKYNASMIPFNEEVYYCPPVACPYFRTPANIEHCQIMLLDEYNRNQNLAKEMRKERLQKNQTTLQMRRSFIRRHIAMWITGSVFLSTTVVFLLGAVFYYHGKQTTKSRFEQIPGV